MTGTYLIFDTETTDLVGIDLLPLHKQPRIIEFSGIIISMESDGSFEELDRIDILLNPQQELSETITKITGLKGDDLRDKPTFAEKAGEIEDAINSASALVGHNLMFDVKMVQNEFRRLGGPSWNLPIKQRKICTVESTEHLLGRRLSLTDLHTHLFGLGFTGAHRAMHDVEATLRCFVELVKTGRVVA